MASPGIVLVCCELVEVTAASADEGCTRFGLDDALESGVEVPFEDDAFVFPALELEDCDPAAPESSESSCDFVTQVSPELSDTQSLSVCTSFANNFSKIPVDAYTARPIT